MPKFNNTNTLCSWQQIQSWETLQQVAQDYNTREQSTIGGQCEHEETRDSNQATSDADVIFYCEM